MIDRVVYYRSDHPRCRTRAARRSSRRWRTRNWARRHAARPAAGSARYVASCWAGRCRCRPSAWSRARRAATAKYYWNHCCPAALGSAVFVCNQGITFFKNTYRELLKPTRGIKR